MIACTKKICTTCVTAAVLLAGAFILLPKGAHNGDAFAGPANPATVQSPQTADAELWKNVPPDPLSLRD